MTVKKSRSPPARPAPAPKKPQRSAPKRTPRKPAPEAAPAPPPPPPAPLGPIVVDGSNVAMQRLVGGKPTIQTIRSTHDELVKLGYAPVIFADASLRHRFPEAEAKEYEKWYHSGFVVQAPKGVPGDEAILEFATRKNAPVLSNDTYEDYKDRYPWISDRTRRVPFNLVQGELILYKATSAKEQRQAHPPSHTTAQPQQRQEHAPQSKPHHPSKEERRRILGERLVEAYHKASKTGEPIIVDDFLRALRQVYPGFRPGDYGYSKPSQMIADFPDLLAMDRRSDWGEVAGLDGPPEWPLHVCLALKQKKREDSTQ